MSEERKLQDEHDRDAGGCNAAVELLTPSNLSACINPQCSWGSIVLPDDGATADKPAIDHRDELIAYLCKDRDEVIADAGTLRDEIDEYRALLARVLEVDLDAQDMSTLRKDIESKLK